MKKEVKFQTEEFIPDWAADYSEKKFTVFSTCFLSTKKNSHELSISEEVLRRDASSILGNFLVAKLQYGDAGGHEPDEIIYGYFPKEQEIVFDESEEGIVKAKAYCVISKMYGSEFNRIFSSDNLRNTSVEMSVTVGEDDHEVLAFDIFGLTCLGTTINGSCPDANMSMVRFDEKEAEVFFKENEKYESHDIDTSKQAVSDNDWDGEKAKKDLLKEKNFESLAPKICLRLEDGWKEREISKLGYPVMGLENGKWVYFKKAISSAMAYAKQNNEEEIVNKLKKLYKKLGLEEGKEGESKMAEIEFAAVDIGDMWGKLWDALHAKYPDGEYGSVYRIDGIYEESNKKFVIIRHKDEDTLYRLDFSLTEGGIKLADEITKVEIDIVETEEVRKFAEPEDSQKYKTFVEKEEQKEESNETFEEEPKQKETDVEELQKKIAEMENDISDKDNIIMEKDKVLEAQNQELEELRKFKSACEENQKMSRIDTLMEKISKFVDKETALEYRTKGVETKFSDIGLWENEVKAELYDKGVNGEHKSESFTRMSGAGDYEQQAGTPMERLKARFNIKD